MLDSDHYQRCLEEQIGVLVAHHTSGGEPDYTFIRDHAHAILQLCEQAMAEQEVLPPAPNPPPSTGA